MIPETDAGRWTGDAHSYEATPTDSPSETVIYAVGAFSGRPVLAGSEGGDPLPPLYETIDPEALDAVVRSLNDGDGAVGRVEFAYCGYDVIVEHTGEIRVAEK